MPSKSLAAASPSPPSLQSYSVSPRAHGAGGVGHDADNGASLESLVPQGFQRHARRHGYHHGRLPGPPARASAMPAAPGSAPASRPKYIVTPGGDVLRRGRFRPPAPEPNLPPFPWCGCRNTSAGATALRRCTGQRAAHIPCSDKSECHVEHLTVSLIFQVRQRRAGGGLLRLASCCGLCPRPPPCR